MQASHRHQATEEVIYFVPMEKALRKLNPPWGFSLSGNYVCFPFVSLDLNSPAETKVSS